MPPKPTTTAGATGTTPTSSTSSATSGSATTTSQAQTVKEVKAASTAARSTITQLCNTISETLNSSSPSELAVPTVLANLQSRLDKLEKARETLDRTYAQLVGLEGKSDEYEKTWQEYNAKADEPFINAMRHIAHAQAQTPGFKQEPPPSMVRPTTSTVAKANMALQPPLLTNQFTPVEVTVWLDRFEAYFRTSNFALALLPDQQMYLTSLMEPSLASIIRSRITADLRIFGEPSCVSEVRKYFLTRYPLFQRREKFFTHSFTGDVKDVLGFLQQLEDMAEAADLASLDTQGLVAFRALSAIQDVKLRRLCAREDNLTLERFRSLAVQRVRESENLTAQQNSPAQAMAVSGQVTCYYCDHTGHVIKDCRKLQRKIEQSKQGRTGKNSRPRQGSQSKEGERKNSSSTSKKNKKKSSYKKQQQANCIEEESKDSFSEHSSAGESDGECEEGDKNAYLVHF